MWAIRACRVCLARDVRVEPPERHRLHRVYEIVAGLPLSEECGMPQSLCFECVAVLRKYSAFRKKCRRANAVLRAIYDANDQITDDEVAKVDRDSAKLRSGLAVKSLPTHTIDPFDHFEVAVIKGEENAEQTRPLDQLDVEALVKKEEEVVVFSPLPEVRDDYQESDGSLKDEPLINYKKESKKDGKEKRGKERKTRSSKKRKQRKRSKEEVMVEEEEKPTKKLGGKKHQIYPKSFYEEFSTITILTREQQVEEIQKRQETANYKNSPLKCTLCFKGFIEDSAFKNHMLRHDSASGEFECDICRRRFRLLRVLNKHVASNHTRRYTCKWCRHVCTNPCQARMHEKWHKGTCYQCPHCDDSFLKFTSYMGHLRKKHPSQFVCEVCGNAFVSEKGVQLHKNLAHKLDEQVTTEGPFCAECGVRFASDEAYKKHLVSSAKHNFTNDCLQGCEECGQTFESRVELRTHLRSQHGRAPHAPRTAPRRAARQPPLDTSWPRKCDQCPVEVHSGREYWQHFRRAHKDQNYPKQPGSYTCEICGRGFKVRALLVYHQRRHTGERPYACAQCGKTFAQNTFLIKHALMHSGELPHRCDVCSKGFQTRGNLNKHYLIHTGNRKYACEYCSKLFRVPCERQSHVDHVHLKKPWPKRARGRRAPAAAPAHPAAGEPTAY